MTSHVIAAGAKRPGFVGDPLHCNSFRQRWQGFCDALDEAGLELDKGLCIMAADRLLERIKNPDLPFCSIYVKTTPVLRNSTMR